jgi:hypothetical protein
MPFAGLKIPYPYVLSDGNFRELAAIDKTGALIGLGAAEFQPACVKALSKSSTLMGYRSWIGAASC